MRSALALAERGLGAVWPNPAVGCVLVRDGQAIGRGWTQPGGRPHAETEALARAGAAAKGTSAYITLEPCSHHGRTPPCADALIRAGIARAVVACEDPDPRVSGAGIARLRAAGIAVEVGLCRAEARAQNQGFLQRVEAGRPLLTLKVASTLDGRIATHSGASRWITGETARAWGHSLRASHDAIMIGIGTALADDPLLTCRLPGLETRSPVRLIVDGRLRLPLTSRLVRSAAEVPTWLLVRPDAEPMRAQAYRACGLEVVKSPVTAAGTLDLPALCRVLAERGLTRILIEGGARLSAGLVRQRLIDRLEWFRAPRLIGGDGIPALAPFGIDTVDQAAGFVRIGVRRAGEDLVESYVRRE
ncbi:MAG: bifunctional diaminohydroxyphosphoribosylaminopyrimidine deaminase/5-amino-6-(5-phosphoribosylamino)uracil reductase RibD [Azospirillum sp.]|nr:bifunctional diaminohydroxyphosphoribosylaminopyrimidine deaminase/5-amino-6-(5-phosphoribosylamino)uracil reductase RibD [Azospirillum sp.]